MSNASVTPFVTRDCHVTSGVTKRVTNATPTRPDPTRPNIRSYVGRKTHFLVTEKPLTHTFLQLGLELELDGQPQTACAPLPTVKNDAKTAKNGAHCTNTTERTNP